MFSVGRVELSALANDHATRARFRGLNALANVVNSLAGLFGPLKGLIGNSLLSSPFKRGLGGGEGGK